MLDRVDEHFEHAVEDAAALAPDAVDDASHEGAKDRRRHKAREEEVSCLLLRQPVRLVQRVEVRSLQPVCERDDGVHEQVVALEERVLHRSERAISAADVVRRVQDLYLPTSSSHCVTTSYLTEV